MPARMPGRPPALPLATFEGLGTGGDFRPAVCRTASRRLVLSRRFGLTKAAPSATFSAPFDIRRGMSETPRASLAPRRLSDTDGRTPRLARSPRDIES